MSVFIRKLLTFSLVLGKVLPMIVGIPVVIVIRMLRPFVIIRFGRLDGGRIGGLFDAEWYSCERNGGMHQKGNLDVFYFIQSFPEVSNYQYLKMWKRVLNIVPFRRFVFAVDSLNRLLPGGKLHVVPEHSEVPLRNSSLKCVLASTKPFVAFTSDEEIFGQKSVRELGVMEGLPFICFHVRDSAFLDARYPKRDWGYHDYRDSSIHNCIPAAEEMVRRGYYAIRMGAIVKEKLTISNPAIIDYACNGKRTDFLDIYLLAKCRFFLCGSDSGITVIPQSFRRPTICTNWVALWAVPTWITNGLVIPKKFYLRKERRLMTFREIINSDAGYTFNGRMFEKWGIELVDNTAAEILAVTTEMDERMSGTWQTSEEGEELQQRFWALFGPGKLKSPDLRIGAEFLRQNRELLN